MRNLLYVNEGLVTFFHSFTFLISNFCHIYRVKIFKFTVQFPIPWNYLFVVLALLVIRFLMHLSTQVKHVHFLIKLSNLCQEQHEKMCCSCNFAVLFENISTTIKHTFYMIPCYRSTWLISYAVNMAQKLEILINRIMGSAIFHGFFK